MQVFISVANKGVIRLLSSSHHTWQKLIPNKKAFVLGKWIDSTNKETFPVLNPRTEEVVSHVPCLSDNQVNEAIEGAAEARKAWAALPAGIRSEVIYRWAMSLEANTDKLAQLITTENGKVEADAIGEITFAVAGLKWYSEEVKRTYGKIIPSTSVRNRRLLVTHQPVGVVGMITPWNFPLSMVTRKAGAALAAGCAVVLKPSDETPLTALAAAFLASSEAGLDGSLLNIVTAPKGIHGAEMVGNIFCSHPLVRQIGFTGSTKVGKKLYTAAANNMKRVTLELGGNAPFIVFESADIPKAVDQAVVCKFRCSGQTCICSNRLIVQKSVYDEFVEKLTLAVSKLIPGVHQGPLISKTALDKVTDLVDSAIKSGAQSTIGGNNFAVNAPGFYYPPTVLKNCNSLMACGLEEIFGPVAPVIAFENEEEAITIANSTPYGLAGYLFSKDPAQCWRVAENLQSGLVGINTGIVSTPEAPFGGIKESGIGKEGGPDALLEFMDTKYICWGDIC